jgi:hypothetical protein
MSAATRDLLQTEIDSAVEMSACKHGIRFQPGRADGEYLLADGPDGKRHTYRRRKIYRLTQPLAGAVRDAALQMIARVRNRFGRGRVWTLGHDSSGGKRVHIIADDGNTRQTADGRIYLRMFYVHENDLDQSDIDKDPDAVLPVATQSAATTGSGWEREYRGAWHACDARGVIPGVGDPGFGAMRFVVVTNSGSKITVKSDASVPPGEMRIEQTADMKGKDGWGVRVDRCDQRRGSGRCVLDSSHRDRGWHHLNEAGDEWGCYGPDSASPTRTSYRSASTPAGRVEAVLAMAQQGAITAEAARELLEMPEAPQVTAPPVDPLDVEYDGVRLRTLLTYDESHRRESFGAARPHRTEVQRAAVSSHWSAELRAKVSASKEHERQRVVLDIGPEDL